MKRNWKNALDAENCRFCCDVKDGESSKIILICICPISMVFVIMFALCDWSSFLANPHLTTPALNYMKQFRKARHFYLLCSSRIRFHSETMLNAFQIDVCRNPSE